MHILKYSNIFPNSISPSFDYPHHITKSARNAAIVSRY